MVGNVCWLVVGLVGKSDGLCFIVDGYLLVVFQFDVLYFDLLCQCGGGGWIVSNYYLDGDYCFMWVEFVLVVEYGMVQCVVVIEMGGKDKVLVKVGGQFSIFQVGVEQKIVCLVWWDWCGVQVFFFFGFSQ